MVGGAVLPVVKPRDWTSHDAIQVLRRILGLQEVGHAGSLDPFATGLLLCGVGRGTKILSYLMDLPKEYVGELRLGWITDTGDRTGSLVERREAAAFDPEEARRIASSMEGWTEQIPPMVSALKVGGRRLYELAREGITVERKPRRIRIDRFEILGAAAERIEFRVVCGKGTYLRALAADFGERLGPGACVERLHRSRIGPFTADGAVSLEGEAGRIERDCRAAMTSLATALTHLDGLAVRPEWVRKIRQGAQPPWRATDARSLPEGERLRLLGPEGELVAIASKEAVPGPIDRDWRESWALKLDRVL